VVLNLPCNTLDLFNFYWEELFGNYINLGLPTNTVLQ